MRFPSVSNVAWDLREINRDPSDSPIEVKLRVSDDGSYEVFVGQPLSDPRLGKGYSGWATVPGNGRKFDSREVAKDLIDQARYHYRNPASGISGETIALVTVSVSVVGLIGYLIYKSSQSSTTSQAQSTALGPGGSTTPLGPATYQSGSVDQTDSVPPFVAGF